MMFILNMSIISLSQKIVIFREEAKRHSYEDPFKMTKVIICSVQEYGEHEEVEGEKTSHLCNLSILYPAVCFS